MNATGPNADTRQLLARDAPGWGWGLDVLMAILILALLNALASTAWPPAIFKAKSAEQVLASTTLRTDVIEHYAIAGNWEVSEGNAPRNFATAAPGTIKWQSRYVAAGIVDGVIVTLGRYSQHHEGLAIMTFRPAVPDAAEQPTVRWLCGHAPTPAGWHGPRVSPAANLADRYLLAQCRKRGAG